MEMTKMECALLEIPDFNVSTYREKTLEAVKLGFFERRELDPVAELVVQVDPRTGVREGKHFSLVVSPNSFVDDNDKEMFARMLRVMARTYDAVAYMFISEAYMVERLKGDVLDAQPSECEDRVEVLQVIFEFEDGMEMHNAKILRQGDHVVLDEWVSYKTELGWSGFGGRFTNVLPREYLQ